jgi:hypothetical protein
VLSTAKYAQQKKFKLKTLTLFTGRGWDAAIDPLTGRILIVYQTLSATGKAGLQGTLCRTDDLSCRDVPKWKTPDSDNAFMPVVRLVRSSFPPFSNVWKVSFWTDAQSPSGDSLRLAQANFISQIGTPPFSSAWALPNYITPCPDDRDPPRWGLGGDYDGTVVLGANTASPVHLRAFTDDQGEGCGPHQTFDRDHAHVSVVELPADISGGAGPFSLSAAAAGSSSTSQTPSQPDSATDGGDEGDSGSADPSEDQGNYHVVLPEVF